MSEPDPGGVALGPILALSCYDSGHAAITPVAT